MSEPDNQPQDPTPRLSDADAAALDRWMDNARPGDGERERRIESLLSLLGTPVLAESDRDTRVSLIDIRARRAASDAARAGDQGVLCDADASALDRWMDGADAEGEAEPARLERQEALAALATSGSESRGDLRQALIERTLAAVEKAETERAGRMRFEEAEAAGGSRFRLSDLVSIAAMLLILGSVALPAMQGVTRHREQAACMANMQVAARAFGTYAGSNADMLPMATAGFGGSWMDVGNPERSNSANLFTMPREGYLPLDDLACPSNPNAVFGKPQPGMMDWGSMDEISYSYRVMPNGGLRMTIAVPSTTRVVVMADRSPVTLRASRGEMIYPEENSPNHGGRGQHVLRLDGSASWAAYPVIEGDNIWLPRQIETILHEVRSQLGLIKGTEMPASETDAFVGP